MRYTLDKLKKYDEQNKTSNVRLLEMVTDRALVAPGYSVQFWRDVQLYGVDEAILYVRNGEYGDADTIEKAWNKIKNEIHSRT